MWDLHRRASKRHIGESYFVDSSLPTAETYEELQQALSSIDPAVVLELRLSTRQRDASLKPKTFFEGPF